MPSHLHEYLYPHMVHEYYVARLRQIAEQRKQRLAVIRTRSQALRYRDHVKRVIRRCFGTMPRRTPLNLQVTGTMSHPTCRIEKLLYESRPGHFVTANLFIPNAKQPRSGFPAVLVSCGHSHNAKAYPQYQTLGAALATQGFVSLVFDPVSQGERLQYEHLGAHDNCDGHNMAGKQLSLINGFFGSWRAWDGIRSLDVLLDRSEVDRSCVGVTGVSGGGTMTTYLSALDDRFTMASPSCFVTTYRANLENELPADAEQMPPGILAAGLDMGDFLIAQAPRPTLVSGQRQDYFDPRGLKETYEEVRRFYDIIGAGKNVKLFIGQYNHGYHQDAREAMYQFFGGVAKVNVPQHEPKLKLIPDAKLFATATGQVRDVKGNRFVYDFIADTANDLARTRKAVTAAELIRRLPKLLNLPVRTGVPHYRKLRSTGDNDRTHFYSTIWSFAVETEPSHGVGIQSIFQCWDPQDPMTAKISRNEWPLADELTLYLPHVSSMHDVLGDQVPARPPLLYTLDVRGIGRSTALTCKNYDLLSVYGNDYMYASHGQMLSESYLGRRVHDVLATLDLIASHGTKRVHLIGRGLGAILATFAALLHPVVKQVTLKNAPLSFHEMTQTPVFDWPLSSLPRGVLREFDLPDCYRALRSRKLRMIQPWDARFKPVRPNVLKKRAGALGLDARMFKP